MHHPKEYGFQLNLAKNIKKLFYEGLTLQSHCFRSSIRVVFLLYINSEYNDCNSFGNPQNCPCKTILYIVHVLYVCIILHVCGSLRPISF